MSTEALWVPVSPQANYVAVTPVGTLAATDVQSALQELDAEKLAVADVSAQIDQDLKIFEYLFYGAL